MVGDFKLAIAEGSPLQAKSRWRWAARTYTATSVVLLCLYIIFGLIVKWFDPILFPPGCLRSLPGWAVSPVYAACAVATLYGSICGFAPLVRGDVLQFAFCIPGTSVCLFVAYGIVGTVAGWMS